MAPTEKDENDTTAACQDEPGSSGSTPSSSRAYVLESNIGIGHEDAGHCFCVFRWDTPSPIHTRKLALLASGILRELSPFDVDLVSHQIVMGPHRNQLTRSHGESPREQSRNSRYPYSRGAGTCTSDTEHERDIGD